MRRLTLLISFTFLLASLIIAQPQAPDTLWTRTYGGVSNDNGYFVQQTSDGGYIITGNNSSYTVGIDVYLIKTDSAGNQQWFRSLGGIGHDYGRCVRQTLDGGYIIAGYTNSYGAGSFDVYLVKTDELGSQQWYRTFGGANLDYGYGIQQTHDGGSLLSGRFFGTGL